MRFKAAWQSYLRRLRTRETNIIFRHCPPDAFPRGLELGAGDGFQSTLLARYVCHLTATDYRPLIMEMKNQEAGSDAHRIGFMACDAEQVDEVFAPGQFDLIFSSNMMEHLPDPHRALAGMRSILADDGIAIHVIPSPFWKLCHLAGFYVNAVLGRLDRRLNRATESSTIQTEAVSGSAWDNNPKRTAAHDVRSRSYLARLLWPAAHGASGSNLREFGLFSRRYWIAQFTAAGFRVAATRRGPVSSGYGFGWDRLRSLLERVGVSSETIYVTVKSDCPAGQPDRLRYFLV